MKGLLILTGCAIAFIGLGYLIAYMLIPLLYIWGFRE